MNWGKVIVIILITFVAFIGGMSYVMFRSPQDDYDHQYYEDGLNFDKDFNKEAQVSKDHAQPIIEIDTCCLKISFTGQVIGTIKMSRPSSDAADTTFSVDNKNNRVIEILTRNFAKGRWLLVFDWKSNHKGYLYKQEIYLK